MLKFADDIKLFGVVTNADDAENMRGGSMQTMRLVEGLVDAV